MRVGRLTSNCDNLHAVLHTLLFKRGALPERFYELIGQAFPGVEALRLEPTGDGRIHLLVKEHGAYMLPANMSDGFYKFLAILTALELRPSLLAIDEIENSIHHETMELLMEELKKMVRVASKELPGAPHETLLVLDATTGQNALSQARLFSQAVPVSGLVLTKLDGTAKGGIIIAIAGELSIPIKLIGVGEGMDDLQDFDAEAFVEALFDVD